MASTDGDFRLGYQQRPQAIVESLRETLREQHHVQRAPQPAPAYSKIDFGQFIRTLALLALCLGAAQLPRADKAHAEKASPTAIVTQ
jgi:hypothetical protein